MKNKKLHDDLSIFNETYWKGVRRSLLESVEDAIDDAFEEAIPNVSLTPHIHFDPKKRLVSCSSIDLDGAPEPAESFEEFVGWLIERFEEGTAECDQMIKFFSDCSFVLESRELANYLVRTKAGRHEFRSRWGRDLLKEHMSAKKFARLQSSKEWESLA